jgi:hypothetical protein
MAVCQTTVVFVIVLNCFKLSVMQYINKYCCLLMSTNCAVAFLQHLMYAFFNCSVRWFRSTVRGPEAFFLWIHDERNFAVKFHTAELAILHIDCTKLFVAFTFVSRYNSAAKSVRINNLLISHIFRLIGRELILFSARCWNCRREEVSIMIAGLKYYRKHSN